jgi:four helix bundle protein
MKPYKELIVWQRANEFVLEIYRATVRFPKYELYGVVTQIRRAALSVPTNIVEGYARHTPKELLRFLEIANASLNECEYLLELSRNLRYLNDDEYQHLESVRAKTSYLLFRFRASKILTPAPPAPPAPPL